MIIGWMLIIGPREDMWPWFERQAQLGKEFAGYGWHAKPSESASPEWKKNGLRCSCCTVVISL
jgi:hypothetical protein